MHLAFWTWFSGDAEDYQDVFNPIDYLYAASPISHHEIVNPVDNPFLRAWSLVNLITYKLSEHSHPYRIDGQPAIGDYRLSLP